jgi:hypothetical protein
VFLLGNGHSCHCWMFCFLTPLCCCCACLYVFFEKSLVATGQVMTRLQLNFWVKPAHTKQETRNAFKILVMITLFHLAVLVVLNVIDYLYIETSTDAYGRPTIIISLPPMAAKVKTFLYVLNWALVIFGVVWLYKLRRVVREKYAIPGGPVNDALLSLCCQCCASAQLLRHTTDYDVYQSRLCTSSGLPPKTRSIV